jgi:FkbM family methyltransferase
MDALNTKQNGPGPVPHLADQSRNDRIEALLTSLATGVEALGRRLDDAQRRLDLVSAQMQSFRRTHAVYLGDFTACTYLSNGWRLLVDTRSYDVGIHLMLGGEWEPRLTRVFERMLFKGATVLDVGSNLGYYSMIAAPIVGRGGKVIAVEPNPRLAGLICHTFSINGLLDFCEILNVAASDQPGVVDLKMVPHMPGGSMIVPADPQLKAGVFRSHELIKVQAQTLDALLGDRAGTVNVIKMDIEGAEAAAFAGMRRILEQSAPLRILLEFNGQGQKVVAGFRAMRPQLEELGFAPFFVEHETKLKGVTWDDLFSTGVRNDIVVCRTEDRGWIGFA